MLAFSPLFDLICPFDIIWCLPLDPFHLLFEGIAKEMLKRLFSKRNTAVSRDFFQQLSDLYKAMKVFSETPRRTVSLVLSKLKGHEYQTLVFSVFPALLADIMVSETENFWYGNRATNLQKLQIIVFFFFCRFHARCAMAIFTLLSRAYHYDDERLQKVEEALDAGGLSLKELHSRFYEEFSHGFCVTEKERCTINIHTFSHLDESRKRSGVLWQNSAEAFESMYAVMRRCYHGGTPNTSKQAVENFYLRDM